jgi:hypothetical protein
MPPTQNEVFVKVYANILNQVKCLSNTSYMASNP